jgi:hypothetical protein
MRFGLKIYEFCDKSGYAYDMSGYFVKQRYLANRDVIPTHETVLELFQKVGVGHKIFMDSYFSSPEIFSDLHHGIINACGAVHHNR